MPCALIFWAAFLLPLKTLLARLASISTVLSCGHGVNASAACQHSVFQMDKETARRGGAVLLLLFFPDLVVKGHGHLALVDVLRLPE